MNIRVWMAAACLGLIASPGFAADTSRDDFLKESNERATKLFDELDTNKDDVLTQHERDVKRKEYSKDGKNLPKRLHGDISRADYSTKADALAGKIFDQADKDHNAVLSDAERQRARDNFHTRLQQYRLDPDLGGG